MPRSPLWRTGTLRPMARVSRVVVRTVAERNDGGTTAPAAIGKVKRKVARRGFRGCDIWRARLAGPTRPLRPIRVAATSEQGAPSTPIPTVYDATETLVSVELADGPRPRADLSHAWGALSTGRGCVGWMRT